MNRILLIFAFIASTAFAWNPPINEESKFRHATWIGRGVITEKIFIRKTDDGYLWKATFVVSETVKGQISEKLEFYFDQGRGPDRGGPYIFRCPAFPEVKVGASVRVFLHARTINEVEYLFLHGDQMIEKEPNQSLETTTMAVTPAASHPSRQP